MSNVTDLGEYRSRTAFRIVLEPGLWNGFEVTIDPPTATHPLRIFKTYDDAMACAISIQRTEGWPIFTNTGTTPGGHAA